MYARNGKDTVLVDDRHKNRLCRVPAMQSGGGGLVGTIDDYARFCQALTAGGALDGERILGRTTIDLMRTNHLPNGGQLRDSRCQGATARSASTATGSACR